MAAEADGAVQRIPGYGQKVEPMIPDGLTWSSWPKFLHPYPLSEKYFLVSCKPTPTSLWGIYLVDVFDNMVLIKELPGYALLEPVPFRATCAPPAIAEKVDLTRDDGEVYIADIYAGDGLKGIPRGTVKSLRLFTYHFAYQDMGGSMGVVGHGRTVGHQAHDRHGAGPRRRLGQVSRAGQHADLAAAARQRRARRCS